MQVPVSNRYRYINHYINRFVIIFIIFDFRHFYKTRDFACTERTQNRGFYKNDESIFTVQALLLNKPHLLRRSPENKIPIFERGRGLDAPSLKNWDFIFWQVPNPGRMRGACVNKVQPGLNLYATG